jgi:hypothetical protein
MSDERFSAPFGSTSLTLVVYVQALGIRNRKLAEIVHSSFESIWTHKHMAVQDLLRDGRHPAPSLI